MGILIELIAHAVAEVAIGKSKVLFIVVMLTCISVLLIGAWVAFVD